MIWCWISALPPANFDAICSITQAQRSNPPQSSFSMPTPGRLSRRLSRRRDIDAGSDSGLAPDRGLLLPSNARERARSPSSRTPRPSDQRD